MPKQTTNRRNNRKIEIKINNITIRDIDEKKREKQYRAQIKLKEQKKTK